MQISQRESMVQHLVLTGDEEELAMSVMSYVIEAFSSLPEMPLAIPYATFQE